MGRTRSAKPRQGRRRQPSLAAEADRHAMYERSVQDPESDVDLLGRLFRRYRRRQAMTLREDFCGTAALSLAWARSHPRRAAIGIDLDRPTLAWGLANRIEPAGADVASRVELIEGDVLDGPGAPADIVCALNFSYFVFKTRELVRRYFEVARERLVRDGLLVIDLFGGTEAVVEGKVENEVDDFIYVWDQESYNPLTHDTVCHIHFLFSDGSAVQRAFTYDWRIWTIPELRELLLEAGFARVRVLWERTDRGGEGTGAFYEPKRVENQESWWTYMVAER